MRPLLGKPIGLRISEEEHQTYTRAAADLDMSLSEYIRLRLVSVGEDYVADQIAQLRLALFDNPSPAETDTAPLLIEMLLLLRRICKPSDLNGIRAELDRLGIECWSPPAPRTD